MNQLGTKYMYALGRDLVDNLFFANLNLFLFIEPSDPCSIFLQTVAFSNCVDLYFFNMNRKLDLSW